MQVVFNTVMGVLTNGVLALMVLAFLPIKVNKWAAIIGFAASYVCLSFLMGRPTAIWGEDASKVSFLMRPIICNPVCVIVALAANCAFPKDESVAETEAGEEAE
jgi:membrane glycosyltransferase